jgi:hypothetical protein
MKATRDGILDENRPKLIQVSDHETGMINASPIPERRKAPTKINMLETVATQYLILHHHIFI